jgi:hypothetical protein
MNEAQIECHRAIQRQRQDTGYTVKNVPSETNYGTQEFNIKISNICLSSSIHLKLFCFTLSNPK